MKLNTRRRIIIPLLFLVMIPVLFAGLFFYMNQRSQYIENRIEISQTRLSDLVELIKNYENTFENRAFIIGHIGKLDVEGLFIIENDALLYNNTDFTFDKSSQLIRAVSDQYPIEDYDVTYKAFNQWNWKLGIMTSKKVRPLQVLKLDGMIIGAGLLFILFAVEAIVLITNNFYKPVKLLLKGYNDIIEGNYQSELDIEDEGEIGMLGHAFNDMKNTIAHQTNKAIEMRQLTDDILRSISTGIITTDIDGRIVKYNEAAGRMIGFSSDNAEEDYDVAVVKILVGQINKTLKTAQTLNDVFQFSDHVSGDFVYYDITTSIMTNNNGERTGVICSFNDISQRKRVEERIERLDRMASLGQLSAGLAHEIRNPLSGMKMSTQVLHSRLKEHLGTMEDKMFLANIKEIDRLNKLITELLEFSKPQTPLIKSVSVTEVLLHTMQFVQGKIDDRKIKLYMEKPDVDLKALFDENQLSQVFLNIISNAIEALEDDVDNNTLRIRIKETKMHGDSFVSIQIEDNGCGIEEENIKHIFDPFYTTRKAGTGLGLAVVHRLVVSNLSELEVSSKVGEGTVFTLLIPSP